MDLFHFPYLLEAKCSSSMSHLLLFCLFIQFDHRQCSPSSSYSFSRHSTLYKGCYFLPSFFSFFLFFLCRTCFSSCDFLVLGVDSFENLFDFVKFSSCSFLLPKQIACYDCSCKTCIRTTVVIGAVMV